jgi:hypothetical protein
MDLSLQVDDHQARITIVCQDGEEVADCHLHLLRQSKFLQTCFANDTDTTRIELPLIKKETFQYMYQFWELHQTTPYQPVPEGFFALAHIQDLVTPTFHNWASVLNLRVLSDILCAATYIQDDNLINIISVYISIKIRKYTMAQMVQELKMVKVPTMPEIQKIKKEHYDPLFLPMPPSKKRKLGSKIK